ncbi:LysE family translocator [Psychrobacter sp. FDAARGOS_221]|uniref:LysE family translocator n=1 Tax=Psychrobacter sp. FDAARGOS_221 TaxID=1975705 RepID=UPI000BB55C05|nr:LysE family translocator [Psychrobacter sp. FDAARGOS_221]PNK59760.1 LysE family translocator [Psychrobacter sp. FDAARGOS_221]
MFGIENYFGFIAACILLNLTPGTDTVYIIMRSIAQGKEAGVFSALGIISGILVHTLLAALGLSVLLSTYPLAFTMVKTVGALYLCYLGVKMLMTKQTKLVSNSLANSALKDGFLEEGISTRDNINNNLSHAQIYKQGILTNVFNPKVALFFLAFFPQFINTGYSNGMLSLLVLGLTFAATSLIWCLMLVLLASVFSQKLRENPTIESLLNKISGVVFIGLGIKLMTAKS